MSSGISQTDQFCISDASNEYSFSNSLEDLLAAAGCENSEGDMDPFGSELEFFGGNVGPDMSKYHHADQQLPEFVDFSSADDLELNTNQESWLINHETKVAGLFPVVSFELLKKYVSRSTRSSEKQTNLRNNEAEIAENSGQVPVPVESIIRLAAEKFIQSASELGDPYTSSVPCQDSEEVQLVQNLLSCAEKVGEKQYERAQNLLLECDRMSSSSGSPLQRLVFYFAEALHEKIDRETGKVTPKGLGKKILDPLEALKSPDGTLIAFHKGLPLSQITKFAGIQAVVENIAGASTVHFIDFEIKHGVQCIVLMQALAGRSENRVEHLKITAVGVKSRENLEETGRQITSFGHSLNLSVSFHVINLEDILNLNKSLFQLDDNEAIAVYASFTFTHMIGQSDRLGYLMRVIRALKPTVMVVAEVEGNCNSPTFVDRFVEALFFYGAYFESMADCLKNEEEHRLLAESTCFGSAIRNVVATEGDDRKIRHVSLSVWRAFFTHFGFVEVQLSTSSVYQAQLVVKDFVSGHSFTFDNDGKSLIIGWRGTPVTSLSAWKLKCS